MYRIAIAIVVVVGGLSNGACPAPAAPTNEPRARNEPRSIPRVHTTNSAGLAEARDQYAKARATLLAATKKGGFPVVMGLLAAQSVSVPEDCRGALRTDLGLVEVPPAMKKLAGAGLRKGLVVVVALPPKAPDGEREEGEPPQPKVTERVIVLCSFTVGRSSPEAPYGLRVHAIFSPNLFKKKMSATWWQFPKGHALVSFAMEQSSGGRSGDDPESTTAATLFAYSEGVFRKLLTVPSRIMTPVGGGMRLTTESFKFLNLRKPRLHLVVRVHTEAETTPRGTGSPSGPDGLEERETETYRIYRLAADFKSMNEVAGAALKALLKRPELAPYRKSK